MVLDLLLKGAVIGFSIAAPVGPIGALCIRTTLTDGRTAGLCTGFGAAAADAVYGVLAVAGISAVSAALIGSAFWLHLIGGAFLCYLGITSLMASAPENSTTPSDDNVTGSGRAQGYFKMFSSTFFLTLSNPMTIMCFSAVFAGIGGLACSATAAPLVVTGVFLGSCCWWLVLTAAVAALKAKLSASAIGWINRASAAVVIGFGICAVASALTLQYHR
jgi:threonine/homoserine/homoserine lactone efflux protein